MLDSYVSRGKVMFSLALSVRGGRNEQASGHSPKDFLASYDWLGADLILAPTCIASGIFSPSTIAGRFSNLLNASKF